MLAHFFAIAVRKSECVTILGWRVEQKSLGNCIPRTLDAFANRCRGAAGLRLKDCIGCIMKSLRLIFQMCMREDGRRRRVPLPKNSSKILQKSSVRTVRLRCRIPTPTSCPWRQRRRITTAKTYLCTHYADSEHLRCLYVFPKDLRPAGFGRVQKFAQSEQWQPAVTARTSAQRSR